MNDIITVNNLSKSYGYNVVFKQLSFSLPRGRVIGLLGENGIGKTTLLRLIAGLTRPDSGEILIDGQKVSRQTKNKISFMLDPANFYSFMCVEDAVQYYKDFFQDFIYEKALELCKEFKLKHRRPIKYLSKGNQERLCLLLCLCRNVPIYLLDEPIAGLDPKFKRDLVKTFLANIDEDATVVICSHLLRDLQSVFDDVGILKKNKVEMATADDIRAQGVSVEDYYMEAVER